MVQIARIELVARDHDAMQGFYVEALGFESVRTVRETDAKRAELRLGDSRLDLVTYDTPGADYPAARAATDPWFQHFAIAVSDMPAAYKQLSAYPQQPISIGGPQLLPPSTGSVTAYKFRDPEGHPLELSFNPAANGAATTTGPFRGIDHSAIAVSDVAASITFYTRLGFRVAERLINTGPEQDRLDGLAGVMLDIVVLTADTTPHLELLHYRHPLPVAERTVALEDVAATRLVLSATSASGPTRDPDGHWLIAER